MTRPGEFEVGVNYLNAGTPAMARELIAEAIAKGHEDSEVWFYRLLAVFSGHTSHQFEEADSSLIEHARTHRCCIGADAWSRASQVILLFYDARYDDDPDTRLLADFKRLGSDQRDLILRHLDLFLTGSAENVMWNYELDRARAVRKGNERDKRVWMFFVPDPANPRVDQPAEPPDTRVGLNWPTLSAALLAAASGYTGWELLRHLSLLGLVGFLAACGGGWLVAVNGTRRQFLAERLRAAEADYRGRPASGTGRDPGKFAREVDRLFSHYFFLCVPGNTDRAVWLSGTRGIRATLQAEVEARYAGSRISADQVRWLIKHHVKEVRRQWQEGEFGSHQTRFARQLRVEALFAAGWLAVTGGSAWAVEQMQAPLAIKAAVVVVAVPCGWHAASRWLHVIVARRRYAAEKRECQERENGCQGALSEWREELKARPSDAEMADWLDADQRFLMNEAMKHYKLPRNQIIAHAFIAEGVSDSRHHRVAGAPAVRYARYVIHVFLLTADGVRQVDFRLDFRYGFHPIVRRGNYRFEAIAAVLFTQVPRSLTLQLVGGYKIDIDLADPVEPAEEPRPGSAVAVADEEPDPALEVKLTPASLTNTVHVLEGIAAEGKEWIRRERRHRHNRA